MLVVCLLQLLSKGYSQNIHLLGRQPKIIIGTGQQNNANTLQPLKQPHPLACSTDSFTLTRQGEIDSFPINHPGCTVVRYLKIDGSLASPAITNLDSLQYITEITENFTVIKTALTTLGGMSGLRKTGIYFIVEDNPNLTQFGLTQLQNLGVVSLHNLPALTDISGFTHSLTNQGTYTIIVSSTGLGNLSGFDSVKTCPNFYIIGNQNMTSLHGFENLEYAGGGINFWFNPALTDLTALRKLTHVNNGSLEIWENDLLTSLAGLENITDIKDALMVDNNNLLTTLDSLNNNLVIGGINRTGLIIKNNQNLAFCAAPAVCQYLLTGKPTDIVNNANGCNDNNQIAALCGTCVTTDTAIWNGSANSNWADTRNWNTAKVPTSCTHVIIPTGLTNYPEAITDIAIRSIDMKDDASLRMGGKTLYVIGGKMRVLNADIADAAEIIASNMDTVELISADIESPFRILDVRSYAVVENSNFYYVNTPATLSISDRADRSGPIITRGNYIEGDLRITLNANSAAATLTIGEYLDEVTQSVIIEVNDLAGTALVDNLKIGDDLVVASDIADYPALDYIEFYTGNKSNIVQGGSAQVKIGKLYISKDIEDTYVIPEQDIFIKNEAWFSVGIVKPVPSAKVIFEEGAYVRQYSSASWVWGTVQKYGNQSFTFPIGSDKRQAVCGVVYEVLPGSGGTPNVFEATYFAQSPNAAGYDTTLRDPQLQSLSGSEYWSITRLQGDLPAKVLLNYDSLRSTKVPSRSGLRVTRWNGAQWNDLGSSNLQVYGSEAMVTSQNAQSNFGIFTLGYTPTRLPEITVETFDTVRCRGSVFYVPFTLDTVMAGGNTFKAQLSDANGSFASPLDLGFKNNVYTSDSIFCRLPNNVPAGSGYLLRVVAVSPSIISTNTRPLIVINSPTIAPVIAGPANVCITGAPVKYYVSNPEAGVSYLWSLSFGAGTLVPAGDTALVTWSAVGTRAISVDAFNQCGTITQQSRFLTVNPPPPVSAPVLANTGRWINATAAPAGQSIAGIRWFRNGVLIAGASAYSYYASQAGGYTARYYNSCDNGPASNPISFEADALPQTISFAPISNKTYGNHPFDITATASSGLPVTLEKIAGPGDLTAGIFTILGAGTVTIRATQAGNATYGTALPVEQSFMVSKAPQSITFAPIAEQAYPAAPFQLTATASSGLPVTYTIDAGPATLTGNVIYPYGLGVVVVTARQIGNTNFLPADAVTQSFCMRATSLSTISGNPFVCPGQTTLYSVNNIPGLTYQWRLSNGSTFASSSNVASITWNTPGTYTLIVSGTGPCGAPTTETSLVVTVANAIAPGAVGNMLPANGATGLQLPLPLSWLPGDNALTYDLYVWDSTASQPLLPLAANLSNLIYTLQPGTLTYNTTYYWRVVSKNACLSSSGPVQKFRLRTVPDLAVTEVQAPAAANSGQTITISWKVKNNGPGNTGTNQRWTDAVFLSFDSLPNFSIPPAIGPAAWNQLEFPVKPLLVATKPNPAALDSGQQYENSVNFTIPVNYSQTYYAYVITNYPAGQDAPLQMTTANDTARAANAIQVSLSPTPDLRVDSVLTTAITFSGSTINVSYKVKNYGVLTPAPTSWIDKVYISPSAIFDVNTAILLKAPKPNNTYYFSAPDAVFSANGQLQQDSSVYRNVQVVVPNFIQGTYFIHVQTNADNRIYEAALSNNNTNLVQFQVLLTPTPQLTINSLNVPFTTASTTQLMAINWNVFNQGFADNLQRNKGHYYVPYACVANGNTITGYRDSLGYGGSVWEDRVYLSNNPAGLDIGNAVLLGTATHGSRLEQAWSVDFLMPGYCSPEITQAPAGQNIANVLRPSSSHPISFNFAVPANLPQGTWYLYVHANANKEVFEFPDTPSIRRSVLPITINRPDLSVPTVQAPANTTGATPFSITYQVRNNGPGSIFNVPRQDRIYISTSSVFNSSAVLVWQQEFTSTIAAGTDVSFTASYTFPAGTSGTRYIFVQTNFDSSFRENNYTNNLSTAAITQVSTATPADLIVSNLQTPDSVFSYSNNLLRYTIQNTGAGTASGNLVDSIFISCNSQFNPATARLLLSRERTVNLAAGGSLPDSLFINPRFGYNMLSCLPVANSSPVFFFVKTNSTVSIYEGNNNQNNLSNGFAATLVNTHVDHVVTSVSSADTATVGRPYQVQWTVRNNGYDPSPNGGVNLYNYWLDGVYFSPDSLFNSNAKLASEFTINSRLPRWGSYTERLSATPPKLPTGDYYVHVRADSRNYIAGELDKSNNTNLLRNPDGLARKVHLVQPLLADLTDSILAAPATVAIGQPLTAVHRVNNRGTGVTYPSAWSNDIWLSTDFVPGNGADIRLSAKNRSGNIQPGQFYDDTLTVLVPQGTTPGNYILIAHADAGNAVIEDSDSNNLAYRFITIFAPAPSDLIVQQVNHADTAWLGYEMAGMHWAVRNIAPNSAIGVSADGVYLTKNGSLDSTAVLMGVKNKQINLAPLAEELITFSPLVTNVPEGSYKVVVRADLQNNITETDKANNTGVSARNVFVGVKALVLGMEASNTLQSVDRYYKLRIPDSLLSSTILITLKTGDSLTMRNEMFVGGGYVPTPARFDYRFEIPNSGNQQIVISDVNATNFYILIRCVSPNPVVQNIKLKAIVLPFAILAVQSNSGGNGGNVTVKLSGSLFTPDMTASLLKPGTSITAAKVYFVNSTTAYATFALRGKPLGLYDIVLAKPDATVASLPAAFSVVAPNNGGLITGGGVNTGPTNSGNEPGCDPGADAGLNNLLVTELIHPDKAFAGWPFTLQINYTNPTNMDIPIQVRTLYNDLNIAMSLTKDDLEHGTGSLPIMLGEPGGPPGFIRAGGTGTIVVHAKAPQSTPGHTFITFSLK